jgi:2-polyprenyl-3-methyl-5-hydroxy-6-metoxy-1,4-benzoquinol methylase
MSIVNEAIYQLNRLRGLSHFAGQIRTAKSAVDVKGTAEPRQMSYHTFRELGIEGIFDLEPHLPEYHFPTLTGKKVIDVGCATGFFSRHFAKNGAVVTAVDIDTGGVRKTNEREKLGLNILEMNCFDMKFENEFDMVFCGSLLLHVLYPMELLRLLKRAVKPGGKLVIASAALRSKGPEIRVYSRRELRSETSTDEAIWWISAAAQLTMLENEGFEKCEKVGTFILASTRYACSQGYRASLLHNVYHATKS